MAANLRLSWAGDYESLRLFVNDSLGLKGSWSAGGERKLFVTENLKIVWKKNKKLLAFDGENANKIIQQLTSVICMDDDANEVSSNKNDPANTKTSVGESSVGSSTSACRCSELSPDLEGLKLDMVILESNFGKIIKALEDKLICTNEYAEGLMTRRNNSNSTGGPSEYNKVGKKTPPLCTSEYMEGLMMPRGNKLNLHEQSSISEHLNVGDHLSIDDYVTLDEASITSNELKDYEVPVVNTSPVNKQLIDGNKSPIIEIANTKEFEANDSLYCIHPVNLNRQSFVNHIPSNSNTINRNIQEVSHSPKRQKIPVRITHRSHRENKQKNKTRTTTHHRLGFCPTRFNSLMDRANHLDLVHILTHGTLV